MKIDIQENKESIIVDVKIKKLHGKNHPHKEKVTLQDILKILASRNIKIGKLTSGPPYVTNKTSPPVLSGTWVFASPKPTRKPTPRKTKNTTTTNKRRTSGRKRKKTLDKSS